MRQNIQISVRIVLCQISRVSPTRLILTLNRAIVFVNNKTAASDFSISVFEDTSCVLESLFKNSKLRTTGSTTSYPHIPFYRIPLTPTSPVSSINLTFLPEFDYKVTSSAVAPNSPSIRKQQTRWREELSVVTEIIEKDDICIGWFNAVGKLRNMVFSVKRSGKKSGLSERDWLKNSSKLWDYLRRSDFVAEYQKLLKRLSQGKD
ncbi:hypothetical protein BKA69DRAFT_754721 [Paraphysoderma sedebokerense]|nr:hypothetical protein BKA69DRAFT_754721 [Paraphysoderma sedebokerense]